MFNDTRNLIKLTMKSVQRLYFLFLTYFFLHYGLLNSKYFSLYYYFPHLYESGIFDEIIRILLRVVRAGRAPSTGRDRNFPFGLKGSAHFTFHTLKAKLCESR